jgi:peroxiredoxin
VALAGDDKSYNAFVNRHGLTFPQALDMNGELYEHFGVPAQPAWVFVTAAGVTKRHFGAMERAELEAALTSVAG